VREGANAALPGGTLEMARAHTVAINAASEVSPVTPLPADAVTTVESDRGPLRAIPGIEVAMQTSIESGRMLHESARAAWSRPAQDLHVQDYRRFDGVAK
jgi:hypothetical protein